MITLMLLSRGLKSSYQVPRMTLSPIVIIVHPAAVGQLRLMLPADLFGCNIRENFTLKRSNI